MSDNADVEQILTAAMAHHDAGRLDQAEAGYRLVLRHQPDEPDALNLLGLILQNRGDLGESIALITRALQVEPDFPEALVNLARAHTAAGSPGAAADAARRAIALDPDLAEAHLQLGHALTRVPDAAGAVAAFRAAWRLTPNSADAAEQLGIALMRIGDHGEAATTLVQAQKLDSRRASVKTHLALALAHLAHAHLTAGDAKTAVDEARRAMVLDTTLADAPLILCCALTALGDAAAAAEAGRRAVALAPGSFDARSQLGLALEYLKNWPEAADCYQAAVTLRPDELAPRMRLGRVLSEAGRHEAAAGQLRQAVALAPDDVSVHAALAAAARRGNDIHGAIAAGRRALELAPEQAELWRVLGRDLDATGQFDEAMACYRRALELNPRSTETRENLARIGRLSGETTELALLDETLGNEAAPLGERIAAGLALGRSHDKSGAYDVAFASFRQANDLARDFLKARGRTFELPLFRRDVDVLTAEFSRARLSDAALLADPSELPVFIVGMPRSGTSLVEQIAASHPRVHGGGESMDIFNIVRRLTEQHAALSPLLWDRAAVRREAASYVAGRRVIGGDADRVTEKMPDNVLVLGHIAMLWPRARVIVCRRDPRDVCLSCYFESFNEPNAWSLDLADCAARAAETERLTRHWLSALPIRMLEVHYETLVADLEGQSRRLIDFLGLEWDPACLEFHKTDRTVLTASQWQVRQPIYTSSIGRWRNYREHLGPLLEGLRPILPADEPA